MIVQLTLATTAVALGHVVWFRELRHFSFSLLHHLPAVHVGDD